MADKIRPPFSVWTWYGFKWAVDDWAHRHLSNRWHRRIFGEVCERLDRELEGECG